MSYISITSLPGISRRDGNITIIVHLPKNPSIFRLLCPHGKELGNDLKGHSLCFRNLKEHKHKSNGAENGVDAENSSKAKGVEHHRKGVRDDDVSDPESEGTDGDAQATDPGWENLCTEDVGDGAKTHHEAAEVDDDTGGGENGMGHCTEVQHVGYDQDDQGSY